MGMKIVTSAPTKVILAGEHAVVHGCPSLAIPIERRNRITLSTQPGQGFRFTNTAHPMQWFWNWAPSGDFVGPAIYRGLLDQALHILRSCGRDPAQIGVQICADLDYSFAPKGMGNSASIAAAWGLALYTYLGVQPTNSQLFEAAQVEEKVAHSNPSGIDARTVLSRCAQRFEKTWLPDGTAQFHFQDARVKLPHHTPLFLAQTPLALGERVLPTADLVARFSQNLVGKLPNEVTAADRRKIVEPFVPVVTDIMRELHPSGNAYRLGELFVANHELLRKGGVVPNSMQNLVELSLADGALGAKGTGACGPGGGVLVLCREADQARLRRSLRKEGIKTLTLQPALHGARVELQLA